MSLEKYIYKYKRVYFMNKIYITGHFSRFNLFHQPYDVIMYTFSSRHMSAKNKSEYNLLRENKQDYLFLYI